MGDFGTVVHTEYNWPYPKPIIPKPCHPPIPEGHRPLRIVPVPPYCHCDAHSYDPKVAQYQQLLEKEKRLCEDYEDLTYKMAALSNDILDHPCDDNDTKMSTIYEITLKKRNMPIIDYRAIKAAATAKVSIPVESNRLGILKCYKDPTFFTDPPPKVRPTIHPARDVHTGVLPNSVRVWFTEYPNRTEYMENIGATGKACLNSMQRYKEPLPSTRRRADDRCV